MPLLISYTVSLRSCWSLVAGSRMPSSQWTRKRRDVMGRARSKDVAGESEGWVRGGLALGTFLWGRVIGILWSEMPPGQWPFTLEGGLSR